MAEVEQITITLKNKSLKKPVKKLPPSINVPISSTLQDVKVVIAGVTGLRDPNRIGLFDSVTGKTFKDRLAVVGSIGSVVEGKEMLVRDLGTQVAWRTVFFIEYLGPILFHVALYLARPYVYPNAPESPSETQTLAFWMLVLHFVKREVETLWVHQFSASTMPFTNIFWNSAFYWLLAGLACGVFIYHPNSFAALATNKTIDIVGLVLYVFGEVSNAITHLHLASLRPKGTTKRAIPTGFGFNIVTCPNYMFEVIAWIGIITVTRSFMVVIFISTGIYYMQLWGRQKEKKYREEFGDKYRKKRYVMFPGVI